MGLRGGKDSPPLKAGVEDAVRRSIQRMEDLTPAETGSYVSGPGTAAAVREDGSIGYGASVVACEEWLRQLQRVESASEPSATPFRFGLMQKGILSNAAPLAAFASRRCRGATLVMHQLSSSPPPTCPPPINQLQPEWFSSTPPELAALNKRVIEEAEKTPTMMELGVPAYRTLRHAAFKHGDPARCVDVSLAGLDGSPDVAARLFFPSAAAEAAPRGALLHLHGGGFVIGSAMGQNDERLLRHAEALQPEDKTTDTHQACGLTVVSVDYRLSPEHTHPAALDDCHAAALWLDSPEGRAAARIGPEAPLLMGGPPAELTPAAWGEKRLVETANELRWLRSQFRSQYLGTGFDAATARLRDPDVSPLHADLGGMPPALLSPIPLLSVGTEDALLEDSLFMLASGNRAELRVYPGAAHGMGHFGPHQHTEQGEGALRALEAWYAAHLP
ncbi:hypothetical protein EMIHUDRAFT_460567 [Emiliania huxleyi CCMP1516]|uniref:Alpha/beta hydrolase fold-3 domain-containing protein n=2 Tax=Emiliania huxleyi TaxID=2903 RepID=A0A0D3KIY6_EMIH1|nr:hypothetical protein EMIHUDRAFT_460567 [Emiliania huxleyi CCMP1516]EOD35721.1 hypothetical protein EMIHUDRAFT_460567 [Emiliania huxleyi CCMP1516]|eukprot:XP_005788150.1 hypothetical protein EMIHUDRAFT_460567 [Emiliania huxleyi CCMP1516]